MGYPNTSSHHLFSSVMSAQAASSRYKTPCDMKMVSHIPEYRIPNPAKLQVEEPRHPLCCAMQTDHNHFLPNVPVILPPLPASRLCLTIKSAAAAAASRSFCRLLSLR